MAKYIKLPDNSLFPVAEGEDYSAAMRAAYAKYPEAFGATSTQAAPKEGLMADVMGAGANLLNLGRTGIAALTGDTTQAAQAGVTRQEELQKKYKSGFDPEKITAPFEQGQYGTAAGEALKQVPSAVATVAPSVLQTAGLAAAGRLGGGALGSFLGPVGTVAGAQIGQYALPAVVGFIQALGGQAQEKVQTQKEAGEKPDVDALALAPYAAGSAALDLIGAKVAMPSFFKKMGGQKVAEETADAAAAATRKEIIADARKVAGRGTFDTILRGTGGFALGELPTEILQDVIDRAAVGKSLTDDEAMKSYRSTALMTVLAAPIGAGVGIAGRSGARTTVEQEDKQIAAKTAAKAAAEAEAAKTTPEALRKLDLDYRTATQQKTALDAQIKAATPKKGATAEEKAAFQQLKDERTALIETQLRPLSQEYNKRKGAIASLEDTRQAELEAQTADQPTAATPIAEGEAPKTDVQRLMLEQDKLRNQLQTLETELEQASPEQFDTLNSQRLALQRRVDARATLIEEAGGSPLAQAEFEQATAAKMQGIDSRMDKLASAYTTALAAKDYDAAAKAKDDLLALRKEREAFTNKTAQQMQALQEKQAGFEQRGQTRALDLDTPAQPEQEGLTFTAPTTGTASVDEEIKSPKIEALVLSQQKIADAQTELDAAVEAKTAQTPGELYPLLDKLNQAQNEASRAVENIGRPVLKPTVLDIFSLSNLFNTAYANGDANLINALVRQTDKTTLRTALDEKASEREKLTRLLDTRFDLGGAEKSSTGEPLKSIERTRADLFSKQYESKQQALFKNGTYPDKELQALYDKGGPAAVEYENVMQQVETLSKQVTTKQGNAKKSLYEQLVELAAKHAELTAQMEAGVAVPTKGEKVAALQAKLGKGNAPATRQMDAAEKYQLQRRIAAVENKYKLVEGRVLPIRDQVIKAYDSLYTTKPLEKASVVADRKQNAAKAEAKEPKGISRTARTATRLAKGDVRKEAEASQKMRDLASDLGVEEAEYKNFSKALTDRYAALKKKYGNNDPAVTAFQADMAKQLNAKAQAIGKTTPEYKATLKAQIEYFKEVLPTAGKQTVPTKRSTQVTRKQSAAPSRLVTSSPESRKQSEAEGLREKRRMFRDFQEGVSSEEERFARGVEVESPDLTPTQVAALQDNDIGSALKDIANDKGTSALNRAVAQRLAVLLDITDVEVVPGLKDKNGREVLGMATSRKVSLNADGGVSQEILLHEGTHAGTERVIQMYEKDPSQLSEMQRVAVRELKALHAAAKADPRITSVNAKSSLSEFVAEVMSNRNLQEQLRTKPWKLSDAFAGFKSIIMRMLGVTESTNTMLGAAITAIDALFVPPSLRIGGATVKKEAATQVLAQKDIAALDSGSNSMREFAAQFGLEIKQKDRTPEDADRIGEARLRDMQANPEDYVSPAEPDKLDYRVTMSDGKLYDADNPLHYVEADAITFANLQAQKNKSLRDSEANEITEQREQDLKTLIKYLLAHPEYTRVEQALVAKAAAKYSVTSDKNGRLKLVTIDINNRHPVAVVGAKGAAAIIEELRTGKTLKEAFIIGLQRNADMHAKDNKRKQGWQKFDQSSKEEDAVVLNAGAAETPWCTGAAVGTARSQLSAGDFYIHYTDGKPDVAIRMDGTDKIGEIRGNSPNQGINAAQQKLTTAFLNAKKFTGSDKYLSELERRAQLIKIAKGEAAVSTEDLLRSEGIKKDGSIDEYQTKKMLSFKNLDSYLSRPDPAASVVSFFAEKYLTGAKKAYENNAFVYSQVDVDKNIDIISVDFAGKQYTTTRAGLKMIGGLSIVDYVRAGEHTPIVFSALTHVKTVSFFQGVMVAPNMKAMGNVTFFNEKKDRQSKIVMPFNGTVEEVNGYGDTTYGVIEGPLEIGKVALRRGDKGLVLFLPDTKYVVLDEGMESTARQFGSAAGKALKDKIREANILESDKAEEKVSEYVAPYLKAVESMFGMDAVSSASDLAYYVGRYQDAPSTNFRELIREYTEVALRNAGYTRKAFGDMAQVIKTMTGVEVAIPDAKLIAPERVGDVAPVQELVEAPEVPVYAPKAYGVKDEGKGVFSFTSRRTPGEFDATPEPSAMDNLLGNIMGLAGRMQLVDKFAAVSEAFKVGMNKGVLTDVEAGNAEYLLRFSEHRSQLAGQALTNGPLALVTTKTDKGIEHTYQSTSGANAVQMAEALNKGGFANDSEAEGKLTLYLSGERAKQVGWEKLNYSDPAAEKAKYQRLLAVLQANPKQEAAIKDTAKIYQQYNNGLMDFLVQTGEITAAKAAELKAFTYVPFYRVNANGEVQLMIDKERPVRIGNIKDEPQLQQLVGDNKQIMPVFASMVQNTFMLTNLGLRNQSVKETAFMLRKLGIASRIGQGPGPANANTVRFKKNGVDTHVVIDTDMYGIPAKYIVEGMEGIKTTIPAVVKLLGIPADILRQFVTRSPTYAIRQMIRDPLNAWLTTGTDAAPVLGAFKELASMVAGRSETERTLMESGAVSSNVFTGDERDMGKVLREITSGKAGWTKLTAKADAFALQGDTATRATIYKDSIAKGMSHQQALLRSVESMNFSRRGLSPSIQMLSTMIPFFNAQIQGLDVLYRAFTGNMTYNEQLKIREKLFQRGLLLAAGTMAYAVAMQDDEAYKRAKPEERYGNWFVYIPGVSEPLRVPIPFELGYLFKSLPEALVNMVYGDAKASDALGGVGKLLAQSNPLALPQAVKPLTEVVLGKSFFSGDIESEREKNVLATDRYRDSSTELSKLLGSVTGEVGVSPIKLDYLIRGYTGGLGIALVQLANPLLNTEAKDVPQPTTKPSKIPFIGGLFQPVEGRGTLDAAYDKMKEIQQVKGTYNSFIEKGQRAEAQAFVQQYSTQLALASTSGTVQKALGDMAKQERAIKASATLTTEQKDAALVRLDKLKVAYARQFLSLVDKTTPQ